MSKLERIVALAWSRCVINNRSLRWLDHVTFRGLDHVTIDSVGGSVGQISCFVGHDRYRTSRRNLRLQCERHQRTNDG